jgi:hypothetical protein
VMQEACRELRVTYILYYQYVTNLAPMIPVQLFLPPGGQPEPYIG